MPRRARTETTGRIVSDSREGSTRRLVMESTEDDKSARHTYELAAGLIVMRKDEIDAAGKSALRHRYEFKRPAR